MREYCFLTITRFVSDLKSDIKPTMITNSYGVDSVEDVFSFELNLTFKRIVPKLGSSVLNVKDMDIMITSTLGESTC